MSGPDPVVQVECVRCHKTKAPRGRSVAMAMAGGLCDTDCKGYDQDPQPDCRWPGERVCGPGCTRGGDEPQDVNRDDMDDPEDYDDE